MKKLLSALLIATMLIASVTCVLAVSAEDGTTDSNVIANLLPAAGEGEGYKITANADGSVTIELTAEATAPVKIEVKAPEGTTFDNNTNAIAVMEYKEEADAKVNKANGADTKADATWFKYSRKNPEVEDGLICLGTMLIKNGGNDKDNDALRTNNVTEDGVTPEIGFGTFDMGKYAAGNNTPSGKHKVISAQISLTGPVGAKLTVYTMAVVKSIEGITFGEGKPLVAPAVTEPSDDTSSDDSSAADTSSDDSSAADTSSTDSSAADTSSTDSSAASTSSTASSSEAPASSTPASSSSTAPSTGDTGLIVFAVLAVLATVGGVVVVRARH